MGLGRVAASAASVGGAGAVGTAGAASGTGAAGGGVAASLGAAASVGGVGGGGGGGGALAHADPTTRNPANPRRRASGPAVTPARCEVGVGVVIQVTILYACGSASRNRVPTPAVDSTSISPPCS
ncbi:MAG: hypothetical protein CL471_05575 [Acidobacteria bacterium]|nr:hypothetical protein [Acidobacteriota bacterium]